MPVLTNERPKKRINLSRFPEDDPAWIELYAKATVAEMEAVYGLTDGKSTNKATDAILVLSQLIQAWNFTDEQGQTIPVTPDSIRRLEFQDIQEIQAALEESSKPAELPQQKKMNSSDTSKPSPDSETART